MRRLTATPPDSKAKLKTAEKSLRKEFTHAAHAAILARGGVAIDPHRYHVLFPDRWSAYLRAHHRSIEEVAVFYDVTARCAFNWWEGVSRPTGDKVALAATSNPEGFMKYMGAA